MSNSYKDALASANQQEAWYKVDISQLRVGDPIAFSWGPSREEVEGYIESFGAKDGQVTVSIREWKGRFLGKGHEIVNTYPVFASVDYRTWKLPPSK